MDQFDFTIFIHSSPANATLTTYICYTVGEYVDELRSNLK